MERPGNFCTSTFGSLAVYVNYYSNLVQQLDHVDIDYATTAAPLMSG